VVFTELKVDSGNERGQAVLVRTGLELLRKSDIFKDVTEVSGWERDGHGKHPSKKFTTWFLIS